jgi:hypothetical protein
MVKQVGEALGLELAGRGRLRKLPDGRFTTRL